MRVLVTGSSGFIGSHIVEMFAAAGHSVRAIDRRADGVAYDSGLGEVESIIGDVGHDQTLATALHGVDLVCHQAAKVGLGLSIADFPDYVVDNALATGRLLAAMDRQSVDKLVLASSMVVYGEGQYRCDEHGHVLAGPRQLDDLRAGRFDPLCPRCGASLAPALVRETDPLDPRNAYASTKVAQEHLAAAWARQCSGTVVALRYHNVYGPRMPRNTPYAGVASIFRSAITQNEAPRVFEDGQQRRDFVHVSDVAAANVVAAEYLMRQQSPQGSLSAFNVATGEVRTVLDLARALSTTLGGPEPVVTGEFRLGDVRHITASASRITSTLGWRPSISFASGMRELAHAE